MPAAQCDPAAALRHLTGCRLSPVKKYRKKRNAKQIKVSGTEFAQWPLQLPVSVREVSGSKVHKQPLWCWLTCWWVRGDRTVTPHQPQAPCWSLVCRTACPAPATNAAWDPGEPQPVAGAGVDPTVGRVDALGEIPSSPFPGSGTLAPSCILCGSISWKALA